MKLLLIFGLLVSVRGISKEDLCSLDPDVGGCASFTPMYFFNRFTGQCHEFVFRGCLGNQNQFETKEDCENFCEVSFSLNRSKRSTSGVPERCLHPPDSGICRAFFLNYYYNPSSGKCETFVYGGCHGNDNNFWSQSDCETICKVNSDEEAEDDDSEYDYSEYALLLSMEALIDGKDACEYPPETGECRAAIPRYYFNGEKCEEFIYGGCQGNTNNFETEDECNERCIKSADENSIEEANEIVVDPCSLPSEMGPCKAAKTRYYFSGNKCETFIYGGCRGNANNFRTEEDCQQACHPNSSELLVESNSVIQQSEE